MFFSTSVPASIKKLLNDRTTSNNYTVCDYAYQHYTVDIHFSTKTPNDVLDWEIHTYSVREQQAYGIIITKTLKSH